MKKIYETNRIREMLKPMATLILLVTLLTVTFNGWAQTTTREVPVAYATIQAAIDAANAGDIINVAAGTYTGNITINKNISILSTDGAATTIIDGNNSGGELGTIQLSTGLNGVTIGSIGHGFTIKGINGNGAIEKAAIYFLGSGIQNNINIVGNIIEARGDAGLMGGYNASNTNITINANEFTGQTFTGSNPSGVGWATQFNVGNNCPRQLVLFGGGAGTTNTQNFTFTNNTISGTSGGMSITNDAGGAISPAAQGNTMVTLDLLGTNTITGNTWSGTTTRYAEALRVRGSGTYTINNNSFTGSFPKFITRSSGATANATCNWYGTTDATTFAARIEGNLNWSPFLSTSDIVTPVCTGVAPIRNVTKNLPYVTISSAVTAASANDVITVAAGTYEELIVIDKPITLNGPNATIAGNGSRNPEAIIQFPAGAADETGLIYVGTNLSGVTIAGFDLKCQDATIASGLFGHYLILTEKVNNLTIRNNRMYSSVIPMYILTDGSMTDYRTGMLVEGNYVDCGPNVNNQYNRGIYVQATSGTIQDNQFLNTNTGIQYMPYGHTTSALIQRNTITAGLRGLYHNYQTNGAAQVIWSQNEVTVAQNDRSGLKALNYAPWTTEMLTFRGMDATTFGTQGSGAAPQVYFNNNKVDGNIASSTYYTSTIGYRTTDASATGVATLTGNSFTNLNMGVVNNSSVSVTATCNWWGTVVPAEIAAKITGSATYIPYSVSDGGACAGGMPVVVTRAGTVISGHSTIQSAIDAAISGDVINVYPGTYNETATNRTIVSAQYNLGNNGPYQFGLFFDVTKPGITVRGVDASGNPITNFNNVLASVTTNATNNFGESGIFVNADNITIQGLKFLDNTSGNNKTVEIIGNNFTMKYCYVDIADGGSIYFNDWSFASNTSTQTKYNLTGNNFAKGCSVDISSGSGYTGLVSDRIIANNVFSGAGCLWPVKWGAISFNGIVPAVGWYVNPVGGATITGNTFADYSKFIISTRGTVATSQFNWQSYWNNNTFANKVIALSDVANFTPRSYSYTNSDGKTFNDVCRIGGEIQQDITNVAQAGDVVMVGAGTYPENVTVNKRITLNGAGATTIISSAATTTPVMTITASGANATDRLVISNLKVTGATGLENPGAGILVSSSSSAGYYTFSGVEATGNQGSGIAFNNTASVTDVIINTCNLSSNGFGLRIATAVPSFDGLTVTDCQMNNNASSAFTYNPSGTLTNLGTNFNFTNCSFADNSQAGVANQHDLSFFGFHGNASLTNVTVTSSNGPSTTHKAYGIVFTNSSAYAAAGTITLNGVTVSGTVGKVALSFQFYNDMSNVSLTDVDISGCTAPWGQLAIDQSGTGIFNIGNTTLKTIGIWKTANVDATSAIFKHATTGAILDRNTLSDCYQIEDQIAHKIDLSTLGLVTVKAGNLFVTTNSYASPYTTTPSIQRGIDAASTGNTVNVAAGNFTLPSQLNLNKAITIRGNNFGIPAATGVGTIPSERQPESIITTVSDDIAIMINAGNIVLDGLHIRGPQRMIRNYVAADNVFIKNCLVENTTNGNEMIQCYGSGSRNNWKFENNRFSGNYSNGSILFANEFTNTLVEENDFMGSGNRHLFGAPTNLTIRGNYFSANSNTLINMNGLNNPLIENNIAYVNGFGFQLTTTGGGIVQNNTFIAVQVYNSGGINYLRGIDIFGTAFSGPNSNGLIIRNNTFQDFTTSATINPTDQYRGIHIRQGATGISITGNKFINTHTGLGIVSATPAVSGIIMTGNDLSGVQIGVNNGSANNVNATNNYWGGCPSVSGPVSYFPYHTSVNGTPGDFEFGPTISNIVASSTNSSTICAGLSTTIFASGGSNYVWDNGLGLGASKVVGPLVNTTYNVTGNDANGCAGAFDDVVIGVNAAPVVKINGEINGTSTIPSAQQVVLTASGAVSYLWSTAETTESITVYPTSVTSYSVVGTTGDCTATATHTITPIIVSAGPNKFICSGNLTTLTATVIGATPASFLWSPGGAITQSIEIAPNTTTVYTVTVTVGGSNPSASVTVFVNSKPVANAGADITIAPAGSGILTGSASNGTAPYSYSWNTTPVQTTANATVSATANAYETYSLTVTDAYGCTSSADNATVTVANTGYTVSGNVAYANLVNNQMHNVTVTLKQDGTTMYSTTTPLTGNGNYEFLGVANGTYTVHLSSPKPWGGVTSADIIAIQNHYKTPNPVLLNGIKRLAADVVDNSSSAIVILNDRTMVNNKRVNPNGVSFATGNWVFAKTAEIGNNGIDYANTLGSTISITVLDGAVTQNFSALCYGDVDASYTGLKENENSILDATAGDGLSLINFPNPFSDVTTIQYNMPVEGSAVIDIFDLIGNKVASISDPEKSEGVHNLNFNAAGMASGIYIYTVTVKTSDDIIIQNGKMIFSR